ncbi:MAG: DinB family protein [Acidobacteria bacterium]|nr:DinB family protein [Acidobacteriota bacterium]
MSINAIVQEFEQEAKTTRRVLERVPSDKLAWKPHAKSMSLGTLAMHIATAPGYISSWPLKDNFEFSGDPTPTPANTAEILATHDKGVATVKENMKKLGDAGLEQMWTASAGGKQLMTMPKGALVRAIMLNHVYHHRGQLSVYLRLLDVPVPSIYGPSADENPFAKA